MCEFNHSENMPGESLAVSKGVCVHACLCAHCEGVSAGV